MTNKIYKIILIGILILNFSVINAQEKDKIVNIIACGYGKTTEEAGQSALRSTIKQVYETFISTKIDTLKNTVFVDKLISITNNNVQSFEILSENLLLDNTWAVILKSTISINKLYDFVQKNGIEIDIKAGAFATNIKQQLINEQNEIKLIFDMFSLLHETMQISFDYSIITNKPKSIDSDNKNWIIPIKVTAKANKNIDICAKYFLNILKALSLTETEIADYKSLNKEFFTVSVYYNNSENTFYLRKQKSIDILYTFAMQWEYYTKSFIVSNGIDNSLESGVSKLHIFSNITNDNKKHKNISLFFLSANQVAGSFTWEENLSLAKIEQITEDSETPYFVKQTGIRSTIKYGGFVLFENEGHGLVAAIIDIGDIDCENAKIECDKFELNGFIDWYFPDDNELKLMYKNLQKFGLGGFVNKYYMSSYNDYKVWEIDFGSGNSGEYECYSNIARVRAIRKY